MDEATVAILRYVWQLGGIQMMIVSAVSGIFVIAKLWYIVLGLVALGVVTRIILHVRFG